MANPKQRDSAAQRREQARRQRDQRLNTNQNTRYRGRGRGKKLSEAWLLVGGIVLMVAIVVGIFVWAANQQTGSATKGNVDIQKALTTISPQTFKTVGAGSAKTLFKPLPSNADIPKGPNGRPQVLYIGADWCPYCAAQRWAIIASLSRFGTFGKLDTIASAEQNIVTFSFHGAKYTSQYIDFVPVETEDNTGKALDTPTTEQRKLVDTYDAPPYVGANEKGSIPFLLVDKVAISSGSFYPPQQLLNLSYQDVANDLKDPNSDVSKGIIGAANYLTTAICRATNNQPANVCTQEPIPTLDKSLFTKASNGSGPALALNGVQLALPERRRYA
ncbi:DUF929 family protein [Ktedonobacter robiniae]|uniref:DUF929 domain-containing protein n=1 Tax=Ktedonobacter robiniae TaxID=2778365 RepID=A0ABQ3UHY9_9CHLR|nr:DUF929 family protein [Ktedonobacter robiniae]GHO52324.1 hypothetical protein KSB_07990 [Ktedonobacter robiniae]